VDTVEAILGTHEVGNLTTVADVEQAESWARASARAAVQHPGSTTA
jgi:hypothetical protein